MAEQTRGSFEIRYVRFEGEDAVSFPHRPADDKFDCFGVYRDLPSGGQEWLKDCETWGQAEDFIAGLLAESKKRFEPDSEWRKMGPRLL